MNSIGQQLIMRRLAIGACIVVLLWAVYVLSRIATLPSINGKYHPALETPDLVWVEPADMKDFDCSIIKSHAGGISGNGGTLSKQFRLAGTFIAYGGIDDRRRAILDELKGGIQKIIAENEEINEFLVLRIFSDHVVFRGAGGIEEELWLSFAGFEQKGKGKDDKHVDAGQSEAFKPKSGRFGDQVGEHSYVYNRDALLGYYNELMDNPERLVSVFDSLKPIYNENRQIEGYHLDVEGEPDFFKEIGWQQGDVVRAVNSMEMSSRHRAEYFIREFVADRANAFLIDMERDGEPMKMVYRVR